MNFLQVENKKYVIFGLANKKSVACAIGKTLVEQGAEVIHVVRSKERVANAKKLFPDSPVFICDVETEANIIRVRNEIEQSLDSRKNEKIAGLVHSIAFANYSQGMKPFHETRQADFLQAVNISCFSFISIANHFKDLLAEDASVVTITISTTKMAAENYGYMAPIKAALDSSLCFLAKSFSEFSRVRFNAVAPALLKTSASAGIPGYIDSYLFAEKAILRKKALTTQEAADTAVFLLSTRSSGINCQTIVVDAGMSVNYFDKEIVTKTVS
ncbi:enoyl-ACP reductase [Desulforhopalus sp. IMCC35007]|uniref:enoyl-ACP reductase FabI n=1 Tax=Desulforhopalus sp. IMCC35007 TaxID=2569543 RepID=UPI0010AE700A|nr:SDR family oxidoreductase [Desulforhopalus sp. IMCC35007]TKB11706.1 SDR family oxidoreductase [Desulforhopalus sp. IMCC35007]